jgi:predicted PurR-regulated permease PerM
LITLAVGLLVIIIPVILLGIAFTAEILDILDKIKNEKLDPTVYIRQFEANIPFVSDWFAKVGLSVDNIAGKLKALASDNSQSITRYTLYLGQNTFSFA